MNIEKRRAEIAARKAEIRKLIEGDTENKLNMDDLEKELRELNEEDEKLEKRQAIERMLNGGAAPPPLSTIPLLVPPTSPRRRTPTCSIAPHGSRPCRVSR